MTTAPPRHIPSYFPIAVYISILVAFTGVLQAVWWLALIGFAAMFTLFVVVVKREFFDDNTPDTYDYDS